MASCWDDSNEISIHLRPGCAEINFCEIQNSPLWLIAYLCDLVARYERPINIPP